MKPRKGTVLMHVFELQELIFSITVSFTNQIYSKFCMSVSEQCFHVFLNGFFLIVFGAIRTQKDLAKKLETFQAKKLFGCRPVRITAVLLSIISFYNKVWASAKYQEVTLIFGIHWDFWLFYLVLLKFQKLRVGCPIFFYLNQFPFLIILFSILLETSLMVILGAFDKIDIWNLNPLNYWIVKY